MGRSSCRMYDILGMELWLDRVPEEAPAEAVQLMEDCLLVDPRARPTAKQIIERLQNMVRVTTT